MNRFYRTVSLACFSSLSCLAVTLPDAEELESGFNLLDFDQSQSITLEEWNQHAFALFQAADANGNQQLENLEIDFDSETENTFARADVNQDGNLDIDEFMKLRRTLFRIADINRGDFINPVEYTIFRLLEIVGWKDRNHNNRINFSELRDSMASVFAHADIDESGDLSAEEAAFLNTADFERATAEGPLDAQALYALFRFHLAGD